MVAITIAAIRQYHRAFDMRNDTEERIEDEELDRGIDAALKRPKKNGRIDYDYSGGLSYEQRDALVAAALAKDPEYLAVKAELGRLLQLGPDDLNPLDLTFGEQEWPSRDDPDCRRWCRARCS